MCFIYSVLFDFCSGILTFSRVNPASCMHDSKSLQWHTWFHYNCPDGNLNFLIVAVHSFEWVIWPVFLCFLLQLGVYFPFRGCERDTKQNKLNLIFSDQNFSVFHLQILPTKHHGVLMAPRRRKVSYFCNKLTSIAGRKYKIENVAEKYLINFDHMVCLTFFA